MTIPAFSIARLPRIEFGAGSLRRLPGLLKGYGSRVLLVTGAGSFVQSPHWHSLQNDLAQAGLHYERVAISGEPSAEEIDELAARYRGQELEVVAGIGGGSVLDAGKALAGLIPDNASVMDYLEGVGPELPYRGPALPYIAVPTTAGTGSEATKNAVLGQHGDKAFKKSFRHETLVPEYALLDPDLLATCPAPQIAANAMDALTQLLESYTSLKANPFTDALAESGLQAIRDGLFSWYHNRPDAAIGRSKMAYAALLSGICLAQTSLGAVHGLASPLGAFFPIPHGVVCGTLVAVATKVNLQALQQRVPDSPALAKYARLGELLSGRSYANPENARAALLATLNDWTERLQIPRLSAYGIGEADFARIVANCRGSSMKTNPLVLEDGEVEGILRERL